ncbi:hypothetical protein H2203_002356 [Taxawa tesnikishii (nom. ined.)]|nr:hypothetical protein H2203_002356 [Dothideales sp. JES 119]
MSGRNTTAGPRPKRNAEAHGRYTSPTNKKPRFDYRNPSTLAPDAPDEDAILELDEIGKGGQQTKRNAINLDGYETDSSQENFDARAEAKAELAKQEGRARSDGGKPDGMGRGRGWNARGGSGKSLDEEENDMFADIDEGAGNGGAGDGDEDEDLAREETGEKGREVFGHHKSGGHVSADFTLNGKGKQARDKDQESSSDEGDDEERDRIDDDMDEELGAGSKKKHAPKLDAFNMQQEGEEGRFDESGNYVRKAADPDAVHDSWLQGLSKKDMKKAREAEEKRNEERRRQNALDDARLNTAKPKEKKERKIPKWKSKKKSQQTDDMEVDAADPADAAGAEKAEDPTETKRKAAVDAITGAADRLFARDQPEIYEQEREMLMRQYKRETGDNWVDPTPQDQDTRHQSETGNGLADVLRAFAGAVHPSANRWANVGVGEREERKIDGEVPAVEVLAGVSMERYDNAWLCKKTKHALILNRQSNR